MFSGASNVKIFGGNFRQVNGTYNHYEYNTTVSNYNSNNVTGNTLTETYNDNSQQYHGVNAKDRAYVRSLRHASALPEVDSGISEQEILPKPSSEAFSTPDPVSILSSSEAYPTAINLLAQPPPMTSIPHVPYSEVSYASRSVGPGDVSAMLPLAAAHFVAAFELMDQDDVAITGVFRGSRENPIPVDNDYDDCTASHTDPLHNLQQLAADESSQPTEYPAPSSSMAAANPIAPPHQFRSQTLEPSSGYSHLAYSMRKIVTDSITHSLPDAVPMPFTSHPMLSEVSTLPTQFAPSSDKYYSSHGIVSGEGASYTASPTSTSLPDVFLPGQAIFNGPYTEISHNNRTMNYPGSGNVANNAIQTLYKTPGGDARVKDKPDSREEPQRRKRQSKYPGQKG